MKTCVQCGAPRNEDDYLCHMCEWEDYEFGMSTCDPEIEERNNRLIRERRKRFGFVPRANEPLLSEEVETPKHVTGYAQYNDDNREYPVD